METSMLLSIVYVLIICIVPLAGLIIALTPYLMPKRECFAVTVPDAAQSDPTLQSYKRRFALITGAFVLAITIACALSFFLGHAALATAIMGVGVFLLCIGAYGLMLYFRSKVQALKRARGWVAQGNVTVASIGNEPVPRPISLKWDLLFLPLIFICLAVCLLGYNAIPSEIPIHIGFDGDVSSYAKKNVITACMPGIFVAFVDAILLFGHWSITRSKKFSDPSTPALSAWAYGRFARAQSMLMVAGGVLLGFVGLSMALSFIGVISIVMAAVWCTVCIFIVAAGSIFISLIYGQNGSRLIANVSTSNALLRDNDQYWKLGIFYMNREDPALFLPERFGIGWTINLGRPAGWALLLGLVAFVVAFLIFVFLTM